MSDRIQVTRHDDGVVELLLVRADKMNALDPAMFDALIETGESLRTDSAVRAVVISGAGRAFCAGLDVHSQPRGIVDGRIGRAATVDRQREPDRSGDGQSRKACAALSHCGRSRMSRASRPIQSPIKRTNSSSGARLLSSALSGCARSA